MEKFITRITEEDFKRLNLTGKYRIMAHFDKSNNRVKGDTGYSYSQLVWDEQNLNEVYDDNIDFCEECKTGKMVIATSIDGQFYFDKYITRHATTFVAVAGVEEVYSKRNYWEVICKDGEKLNIKKELTKNIYFIYKN